MSSTNKTLSDLIDELMANDEKSAKIFGNHLAGMDKAKLTPIIEVALTHILTRPQGMKKHPELKALGYTSRTWSAFCAQLVANNQPAFKKLEDQSLLFAKYKMFWPACADQITRDILALEPVIKEQNKVKELLSNIVK